MRLITWCLLFMVGSLSAQDTKKDYNLLWEIKGKALTGPSYLFGTMHVMDERAFEFSDSVLIALDQVDAFAMEILPDSLNNAIDQIIAEGDTTDILRTWLSEEAYKKMEEELQQKTGQSISDLYLKNPGFVMALLADVKEFETTEKRKMDVDAYLFQAAYRQGKSTFSLERFEEYEEMNRSFFAMFEKGTYKYTTAENSIAFQQSQLDRMIEIYQRGNIEEVVEFIEKGGGFDDQDFENAVLYNRNYNMMDMLDSLMQGQSVFCAIGVAHLPGEKGAIQILKDKGYQVRLVQPTFTGYADNYQIKEVNFPWQRSELNKFKASVLFPNTPEEIEVDLSELYPKYESWMYIDEWSETEYLVMALHHKGFFKKRADESFYKDFVKKWNASQKGEIIKSEFLTRNDKKVMQVLVKDAGNRKGFSVWNVVKEGSNVFFQAVTNESGDFNKKVIVKFFESLKIEEEGLPEMFEFKNEVAAIRYEMPVPPKHSIRKVKREELGEHFPIIVHSYLGKDEVERFNYLMMYRNNPAGMVFENLDEDFAGFQKTYEEVFKSKARNAKRTMFKGYPALELSFELKQSELQLNLVCRGNRMYFFMVEKINGGGGFEEKKAAFFDSIEFLPLEYIEPARTELKNEISINLPVSPIEKEESILSYPFTNLISYYSLDTLSSVGYTISDYQLSPFYFDDYDSLMQADREELMELEDLLIFSDTTFQGHSAWYMKRYSMDSEMIVNELIFYSGAHYVDMMVSGGPENPDSLAWNFFNSFNLNSTEKGADFIRRNKQDEFWKATESQDSLVLDQVKFFLLNDDLEQADLNNIYDFLEKDLSFDTLSYLKLDQLMLNQLEAINDETLLAFLANTFEKNTKNLEFQSKILNSFLDLKTKESFEAFFKYAKDFNEKERADDLYVVFSPLKDTVELSSLFAEDLMGLLEHKEFSYEALSVLKKLYNDTTINIAAPDSWRDEIVQYGVNILSQCAASDSVSIGDYLYDLRIIDDLLTHFNKSESIAAFAQQQLNLENLFVATDGLKLALHCDLSVEASTWEKIFQSKYHTYYLMQETSEANTFDKIPDSLYNQDVVVEGLFSYEVEWYEYGVIQNFKTIERRLVKKGEKSYLLHVVQFDLEGYKIPQVGVCIQPQRAEEVEILPSFYRFDDWEEEEETRKEFVDKMIERFKELETEE